MRTLTTFLAVCVLFLSYADGDQMLAKHGSLPKLELSVDPAGFLFYGPSINVGVGILSKTSLQAYVRPFGMGGMSVDLKSEPDENDELSGTHFGVGVNQFIGDEGRGLYVGLQAEFGSSEGRWSVDEPWEWYEESTNMAIAVKGGLRLPIKSGLFVNVGANLGMIQMDNKWEYEDVVYGATDTSDREHSNSKFIYAVEVGIGYAIL